MDVGFLLYKSVHYLQSLGADALLAANPQNGISGRSEIVVTTCCLHLATVFTKGILALCKYH